MTRSSPTAGDAAPHVVPRNRSIVSRLAAPFATRQRSPVEHEIKLDEPFRTFLCGDVVRGAVLLNAAKPLRITHLVIRLHGFVKVVNDARLPGDTIPYDENLLTSMKHRKGIEYFGNGFARLFEDEFILCGEGRLFGKYEFRFELTVPSDGLPSSIDFEHGTIAYLLSSTLTRPTTISPTLTCHQKLNILGNIDIARIPVPRPRMVSVEAVSKKTAPRLRAIRRHTGPQPGRDGMTGTPGNDDASVQRDSFAASQMHDEPPQSPVPSDLSTASAGSSLFSASNTLPRALGVGELHASTENLEHSESSQRTIVAHTEVFQGACLPGGVVNLKITVEHTKAVKTMQGIVVTIYRQGRIDTHPAIPLGPMDSGDRKRYEDYYPRSWTGLGGLSLSSAGSSRAFRQDLAQTITPLIVDPHTLTAVVRTSIQMPDHVFPTITAVPGDMVSFKYYVEAVIDLRGKSAGQDRFRTNFNIVDGPRHAYGDPRVSKVAGADGVSYSTTPGFNYLITDQMRRTRGVVFTANEIVVGTRDSNRGRPKQREGSDASTHESFSQPIFDENGIGEESPPTIDEPPEVDRKSRTFGNHSDQGSSGPVGYYDVPPPEIDDALDEKAMIRRAEQTLLPSAPPQDGPSSMASAPSAPFAYDEEDFMNRYALGAPAPAYEGPYEPSSSRMLPVNGFDGQELPEPNGIPFSYEQHALAEPGDLDSITQEAVVSTETAASSPRTVIGGKMPMVLPNGSSIQSQLDLPGPATVGDHSTRTELVEESPGAILDTEETCETGQPTLAAKDDVNRPLQERSSAEQRDCGSSSGKTPDEVAESRAPANADRRHLSVEQESTGKG